MPTKNPLYKSIKKYKSMGWFLEFYTTLLYVSDIGTNSFAQFQLSASNLEKEKYLKKEEKNTF